MADRDPAEVVIDGALPGTPTGEICQACKLGINREDAFLEVSRITGEGTRSRTKVTGYLHASCVPGAEAWF